MGFIMWNGGVTLAAYNLSVGYVQVESGMPMHLPLSH